MFRPITILILLAFSSCEANTTQQLQSLPKSENSFVLLSEQLMVATKAGEPTDKIQMEIATLDEDKLSEGLNSEEAKKAFWINVYNANIIILLRKDKSLYNDRGKFFSTKQVEVAGKLLSFDDIEHGIIRSSKIKLSLGLLKNPFAPAFEKKMRTKKTDPRIHFALNCGAKSCPPVAIHNEKNFNGLIDEVAEKYLAKTTEYDKDQNTVYITPLMSWFRGDFGGKSGAVKFLKKYKALPEDADPKIEFQSYDWTLDIDNFYK